MKAIKKHTDFFEVNEGTLFSASTHERITDKNMSGNRLEIRPIKSLALKNTILAKIAIKIKTKQLNWEFWDKHNNENTKI